MRARYWSCSKFADWIRGAKKPGALTAKGWREFDNAAETAHPIRYWIAEEGLTKLQNFVNWPTDKLYSAKYYLVNRFITKTNALTAHPNDIKPGKWRDVGDRFLPCMFNELVNFVEIELAWSHVVCRDEEQRKKYKIPSTATGWFRTRTWRCAEAGLDHLNWAASLVFDQNMGVEPTSKNYGKPTSQAEDAKEILALYHWWKNVRPERPDPHIASGWHDICERRKSKFDDILWEDEGRDEKAETRKALALSQKLENMYEKEDTEMMVRLIRIRNGLWT